MRLEQSRINKVQRFLSTAQLALDDGDADSCVSQAYYAVFHAIILLFEARGNVLRGRWSHIEVQKVFSLEFCNRGYLGFSKRDADTLVDLQQARLNADYGLNVIDLVRAERLLRKAASLLPRFVRRSEMGRRDRQISEAVWEFARRLREIHPEAKAVIQDFKWEEEDVYIEVKMPPMTKEEEAKYDEEEGDIYEKVSRLTNDIFDELTNGRKGCLYSCLGPSR